MDCPKSRRGLLRKGGLHYNFDNSFVMAFNSDEPGKGYDYLFFRQRGWVMPNFLTL